MNNTVLHLGSFPLYVTCLLEICCSTSRACTSSFIVIDFIPDGNLHNNLHSFELFQIFEQFDYDNGDDYNDDDDDGEKKTVTAVTQN